MTANQINYYKAQEEKRYHMASELLQAEANQINREAVGVQAAQVAELARHNQVTEEQNLLKIQNDYEVGTLNAQAHMGDTVTKAVSTLSKVGGGTAAGVAAAATAGAAASSAGGTLSSTIGGAITSFAKAMTTPFTLISRNALDKAVEGSDGATINKKFGYSGAL